MGLPKAIEQIIGKPVKEVFYLAYINGSLCIESCRQDSPTKQLLEHVWCVFLYISHTSLCPLLASDYNYLL